MTGDPPPTFFFSRDLFTLSNAGPSTADTYRLHKPTELQKLVFQLLISAFLTLGQGPLHVGSFLS